jgi:hypothetical protein
MRWLDSILAWIYQRLFAAHVRSPLGQKEFYRRLINRLDETEFITKSVEQEVKLQLQHHPPASKEQWQDHPRILEMVEAREKLARFVGKMGACVLGFDGTEPVIYCWLISDLKIPLEINGIPVIKTSYTEFCTFFAEAVRKLQRE